MAAQLGLNSLLYRNLVKENSGIAVPQEVVKQLKRAYAMQCLRNTHLRSALDEILTKLTQADIPVILLKGIFLSEVVYADPGLRPMADLDLLVRRGDLQSTTKILEELGFQPIRESEEEIEVRFQQHMPPYSRNGVVVEAHWSIANPESPHRVDLDGLWQRVRPIIGMDGLGLSPEDLVLHLSMHVAQHNFRLQLRGLCDLQEVIDFYSPSLDWTAVANRSLDWQAGRAVYLALTFSRDLLKVNIPEDVLKVIHPADFSEEVYNWAREQIFQTASAQSDNFFILMQKGSVIDRISAFFLSMLPSPLKLSRIHGLEAGSWRIYWYYLPHWVERIKRYSRSAVRILRGDPNLQAQAESQLGLLEWLNRA